MKFQQPTFTVKTYWLHSGSSSILNLLVIYPGGMICSPPSVCYYSAHPHYSLTLLKEGVGASGQRASVINTHPVHHRTHTHTHTHCSLTHLLLHEQFRVSNQPSELVFGLWEETSVPGEIRGARTMCMHTVIPYICIIPISSSLIWVRRWVEWSYLTCKCKKKKRSYFIIIKPTCLIWYWVIYKSA